MKAKKWVFVFSVSAFVFCFWSTVNFSAEKEPIQIGSVFSFTGFRAEQARDMVEGNDLAVEDINSKGGLLGRPLKAVYRDDEMKPPVGVRRFEELVKNQGIVLANGSTSGPVAQAIQQANKRPDLGIILIQNTTNVIAQGPKIMQPNLFFSGCSQEAYGLAGGEYAAKHLGKKAFLLYPDYSYGWTQRDGFMKSIPANGGEIVGSIGIPGDTNDYGPFLTQILAKKPDYVVLMVDGLNFINCLKQAYALGLKDKMRFVNTFTTYADIVGCGPELIKDVIMISEYFPNLPNEKNKIFVEKFMKKYHKPPSSRAFIQYVGVLMWADAVKKAGTVDPKTVAGAFLGLKGDYGGGNIEVRRTGDHTTIKPLVVARGKGPNEMKDKFDTQEIMQVYTGEKYFYSAQEKGW